MNFGADEWLRAGIVVVVAITELGVNDERVDIEVEIGEGGRFGTDKQVKSLGSIYSGINWLCRAK